MKTICEKNELVTSRPIHNLKRPFTINESARPSFAEKVQSYKSGKVRFSIILQTAGDTNQNRRLYPKDVLVDGVNRIMDAVKKRAVLGELDHPISDDQTRQTTVLYEHCSHIFVDLYFNGNELWGVLETTPYTPKGRILSGLILDKVTVGASLRGLADLEDSGRHQIVLKPLVVITWDMVSNPSHKSATIREVYEENVSVLNESTQIVKCKNGICYLAPNEPKDPQYLIEQEIRNLHKKYWK